MWDQSTEKGEDHIDPMEHIPRMMKAGICHAEAAPRSQVTPGLHSRIPELSAVIKKPGDSFNPLILHT